MTIAPGTPIQGVTLYSFTRAFHRRDLTVSGLIREVAARGLGPGLEIVGFQSIRDFPRVDASFVSEFRGLIDETGLIPTALGANADVGRRRDRRLTNDELVEYMTAQIRAAKLLGFPIVRLQFGVTPDDMERLLPVAEELDVVLGIEMHAPHSLRHPVMAALLERYERLGSPRLGFIPDWGASMDRLPRTLLGAYRSKGLSDALLEEIDGFWNGLHGHGGLIDDAAMHEQFGEVVEIVRRHGFGDYANEIAVNAAELFGHAHAAQWADVLPWAVHTHGKFYEIDANGDETSVPIPEIMRLYVEQGYSRTISTEWEGFHWNRDDDAFDLVGRQQALIRRSVEAAGSHVVTRADEAAELIAANREEWRR